MSAKLQQILSGGFAASLAVALAAWLTAPEAQAQLFGPPVSETQIVDSATLVLQELNGLQVQQIPHSLLASAEAVAIVPGMVRGAFVVGLQRGRGVVLIKDEAGAWSGPQFMTITGGSVGWQAGIQATDLVLVFASRGSVRNLLQGKVTVGVDASAAAGPIGRRVSAATDLPLQAEIYSYSRSRGLFAGVSLDGSSLQMDAVATSRYYATAPPQTVPPSATALIAHLQPYGIQRVSVEQVAVEPRPQFAETAPPAEMAEMLRRQLAPAMAQLDPLLDPQWRAYLQIPNELLRPSALQSNTPESGPQLSPEPLQHALQRYDAVASNPQYAGLAQRPEFQLVRQLLHRLAALPSEAAPLSLPPPPSN